MFLPAIPSPSAPPSPPLALVACATAPRGGRGGGGRLASDVDAAAGKSYFDEGANSMCFIDTLEAWRSRRRRYSVAYRFRVYLRIISRIASLE